MDTVMRNRRTPIFSLNGIGALFVIWTGLTVSIYGADDPTPAIESMLARGRVDDLIREVGPLIQASPNNPTYYLGLGQAYLAVGDRDRAISSFERAVAVAEHNSMAHLWLGRAYGDKADHSNLLSAFSWAKRARLQFEESVRWDNSNTEARSDLAEFYIDAPGVIGGGADKARQQIEYIDRLHPDLAHFLRARLWEKEGNPVRAEEEFTAAIRASDEPARYWMNLASFYRRWKRLDEMQAAIKQGVNAHRNRADVLFYGGEMLFESGRDLTESANLLRLYLRNPDSSVPAFQAHSTLGAVLEKLGNNDEAAVEYRAALALASEYDLAREGLARVQKQPRKQ